MKKHLSILVLLLFGLSGEVLLVSLGLWQLKRADWKENIIERIAKAPQTKPTPVEEITSENLEDHMYSHVDVHARWGKGPNYYVLGKTFQKRPGYHLMNVVTLPNGTYLLVNIGWVPEKTMKLKEDSPADFVGRVRDEEKSMRWILPNHKPGIEEWSYVDFEAMGDAIGVKLLPFYVDMVRPDTGRPPYPVGGDLQVPNSHLGYAWIWFTLAGIWLIFLVLMVKRKISPRVLPA